MGPQRALIVGNSDGIGLAMTAALLDRGWDVIGLSRSTSPLAHTRYEHAVIDVRDRGFGERLASALRVGKTRLVVYCAGIGEAFDATRLRDDVATFEVNLMGLVRTVELSIPHLIANGAGVFVGLSSVADILRSRDSPAYGASKAGMSHYLESLALAVQDSGVRVVNVRLGFVDTKMAKADWKPWILKPEDAAARILEKVLTTAPPRRLNIPRRMAAAAAVARLFARYL